MTEFNGQHTGDGFVVGNYEPERAIETTQVRYPWRATVRTIIAVLVGIGVVAPAAWAIIGDELATHDLVLPPEVVATITYTLAVLAVVVGAVTRIMALAPVAEAMTRIGIGPAPKES